MEQNTKNLLEMIDRPIFLVRDGIIVERNEMAKHRLITVGKAISELIPEECDAYRKYQGGILYLTLQIDWIRCGATVVRQEQGDVFLMDRDADQSQLQALALAAQQLRVPLSNVMTLSDLLLEELREEGHKERASQMQRSLFQLMRIIGNMADAERYTLLQEPVYETTELRGFFREIVEKAGTTLEKADVRVQYSGTEYPVFSMIDRERMERAVYNLLSNAVKFSAPGSVVTVMLRRTEKMACLTVEDQGDGIADHAKGSLFYRYMREPSIEDSRFGLGLGMTLVRSAAALHGGTVLLEQAGGTRVAMTMEIRRSIRSSLRSPILRISDYGGGRDLGLLEFSETLPPASYE